MGVCHIHMADTVQFFVLPGVFMLFDQPVLIIVHRGTGHNPRLGAAVHGQLIDIIAGRFFYYKGALCNHGIEEFPGLCINPWIISIYFIGKLSFRPVNPQEGERLFFYLCKGFLPVINVIGQSGHMGR